MLEDEIGAQIWRRKASERIARPDAGTIASSAIPAETMTMAQMISDTIEVADWRNFRDNGISGLRKKPLPWYAGGLGHSAHVADFDYWSRMP